MISNTRALLPYYKQSTPPLTLDHDVGSTNNVQRRLQNRIVLTPAVDLEHYSFRAVIDWIEFRVRLARPTQVQHVQAVLRRFLDRDSYIDAEDKGAGDVFSICTIKVQEPASLAQIAVIHKALVDTFGEAEGSRVTGLEVSVDATPKESSDAARALLLGAMQRTIWTDRDIWSNRSSRPRSAFGRGDKKSFTLSSDPEMDGKKLCRSDPAHHFSPAIDGTMYLGAKEDDVMIRVMDKVIDRQRLDGTFTALEDNRKRVRVEVRLMGAELTKIGVTDIASLGQLNLTSFQKRYFQFMLPTFSRPAKPLTAANVLRNTQQHWRVRTYLNAGVTGLMGMDAAVEKHRKKFQPGLQKVLRSMNLTKPRTWAGKRLSAPVVSWAAMNNKVNAALRDLMKREATAKAKTDGV